MSLTPPRRLEPRRGRRASPSHARAGIARLLKRMLAAILLLLAMVNAGVLPVTGQGAAPHAQGASDSLLITPTTQGVFHLPETGVTLEISYATVNNAARITVTRSESDSLTIDAWDTGGVPLARFEMPVLLVDDAGPVVVSWPGPVAFDSEIASWLVVFDAHGLYAVPADAPDPGAIFYLGPLEHFHLDLVAAGGPDLRAEYAISEPVERAILVVRDGAIIDRLPTAARAPRYRDRFVPEDLGNPGGFMLVGWAEADQLPDLVRALRGRIPDDPDLPAPGVPQTPIRLIPPFDCRYTWVVSWGYHHSTPQNRFAVDFATVEGGGTGGQSVYAAHAGTLFLKRYGTPDHLIDVGLAARVIADDGITSTVYGHLDPSTTFEWWRMESSDLPDFEWVEIGPVRQGQMIGIAGSSGYATGPHIHFALWSWDQSLYQPVPLGSIFEFSRGLAIPHTLRDGCEVYHR